MSPMASTQGFEKISSRKQFWVLELRLIKTPGFFDVHLFVLIPLVPFIKMPFLKPVFLDRQVREMLDMYQFPGDDTSGKLC